MADIHGDVLHIVGEALAEDGEKSVLVRVGNAPVYDLRTGFRRDAADIRLHTDIRAAFAYGNEPADAVVLWLNWSAADAAVFTVRVSENINFTQDGAVFLSADGKYRLVLSADTVILCPFGDYLTPRDILPGMEFFVWVDVLTASTPAMVYPEKVVLVS